MRLPTKRRLRTQTSSASSSIGLPRVPPIKLIHTQNISIKEMIHDNHALVSNGRVCLELSRPTDGALWEAWICGVEEGFPEVGEFVEDVGD